MNNAPVTLILIAAVGLIAVLSLGIFFAVRPRTKTTVLYYGKDAWSVEDGVSPQTPLSVVDDIRSETVEEIRKTRPAVVTPPFLKKFPSDNEWYRPSKKLGAPNDRNYISEATANSGAPNAHQKQHDTFVSVNDTFGSSTWTTSESSILTGSPTTRRITPEITSTVSTTTSTVTTTTTTTTTVLPTTTKTTRFVPTRYTQAAILQASNFGTKPIKWVSEKRMSSYRKVVGIAYKDGVLYAPSHETGKISLLNTPNLKLLDEIRCPKCRIYDIDVLNNGDLVVAQGRRKKLSKIGRETRRIVQELHLNYATKGLAVSRAASGEEETIFVLARSHDKVQKYRASDLQHQGTVYIPNENYDDCNFLTTGPNHRLIISCENNVYILDSRNGEFIHSISSRGGSYSVGIAVDRSGKILVVRRGKSEIDIYSSEGRYEGSLGDYVETLWSDIAVGDGELYIVDYIRATIRAIEYA